MGQFLSIIEEPYDQTPKLVYADYLEESGESNRAIFIRTQCEVANRPHGVRCGDFYCTSRELCGECAKYKQLCRESERLYGLYSNNWFGGSPLPVALCESQLPKTQFSGQYRIGCVVSCGFISEIYLTTSQLFDEDLASALFSQYPITKVTLVDKSPELAGAGFGPHSPAVFRWRRGCRYDNEFVDPMILPAELYRYLDDKMNHLRLQVQYEALSKSCVKYGRNLVGLSLDYAGN